MSGRRRSAPPHPGFLRPGPSPGGAGMRRRRCESRGRAMAYGRPARVLRRTRSGEGRRAVRKLDTDHRIQLVCGFGAQPPKCSPRRSDHDHRLQRQDFQRAGARESALHHRLARPGSRNQQSRHPVRVAQSGGGASTRRVRLTARFDGRGQPLHRLQPLAALRGRVGLQPPRHGLPMASHMPNAPQNTKLALRSDWLWWADNGDDMNRSGWLLAIALMSSAQPDFGTRAGVGQIRPCALAGVKTRRTGGADGCHGASSACRP